MPKEAIYSTPLKLFMLAFLTCCTYSINMIENEGQASDVIDETSTATPSTSITAPGIN